MYKKVRKGQIGSLRIATEPLLMLKLVSVFLRKVKLTKYSLAKRIKVYGPKEASYLLSIYRLITILNANWAITRGNESI
jgi:hypothetical protein